MLSNVKQSGIVVKSIDRTMTKLWDIPA